MSLAKYLVLRKDGTVPRWPWFVLGARDLAARDALVFYRSRCEQLGYAQPYLDAVDAVIASFEAETATMTRPDQHEQGRGTSPVKALVSNIVVAQLLDRQFEHVYDAVEFCLRKAMGR